MMFKFIKRQLAVIMLALGILSMLPMAVGMGLQNGWVFGAGLVPFVIAILVLSFCRS